MGFIKYGGQARYEFEDRQLAHLQVAVQHKLRQHESFLLSWIVEGPRGGRVSLWIAPSIPLTFHFSGSRTPTINAEWVEVMERMSNTPRGLVVLSEEDAMLLLRKESWTRNEGMPGRF